MSAFHGNNPEYTPPSRPFPAYVAALRAGLNNSYAVQAASTPVSISERPSDSAVNRLQEAHATRVAAAIINQLMAAADALGPDASPADLHRAGEQVYDHYSLLRTGVKAIQGPAAVQAMRAIRSMPRPQPTSEGYERYGLPYRFYEQNPWAELPSLRVLPELPDNLEAYRTTAGVDPFPFSTKGIGLPPHVRQKTASTPMPDVPHGVGGAVEGKPGSVDEPPEQSAAAFVAAAPEAVRQDGATPRDILLEEPADPWAESVPYAHEPATPQPAAAPAASDIATITRSRQPMGQARPIGTQQYFRFTARPEVTEPYAALPFGVQGINLTIDRATTIAAEHGITPRTHDVIGPIILSAYNDKALQPPDRT